MTDNKTIYPLFIDNETCEFSVWVSKAKSVHLELKLDTGVEKLEMEQGDRGYWHKTVHGIQPGSRYKYLINEKDSFPDPASLSQPHGVHDYSELIDIKSFNWGDHNWNNVPQHKMIQYELHTGTFSNEGTFDGIVSKLDYLKELGINTIEILPVAQFSGGRNWGYDGVYPFAVHNTYGGAFKLMYLVNECHKKGFAVVLDVVYNHLGPEGNYISKFGHYFSGKYSTPWGNPLNFDGPHSDEVRKYFIENAMMWFRYFHIDALRLDAIHAIYDFSTTHFLQELAENLGHWISKSGKKKYLIAESHLNDVKYISGVNEGGYGLNAQWSDDFHHAIHSLVTGEKKGYYMDFGQPQGMVKAIQQAHVFDGQYSLFRKKSYGNKTDQNPGEQFVIFNQNHDQVGNRKNGDRLISLTDFETAKLLAGAMLVAPYVPMLFMGEEYAERNPFYYFVSHLSPELNKLVKEGRQREFESFYKDAADAPDPSNEETFELSKLSWNIEASAEKMAMFRFYQRMIQLRHQHVVLKNTNKKNLEISSSGKLLHMRRWEGDAEIMVLMNFDQVDLEYEIKANKSLTFRKIINSASEKWNGLGDTCPDNIENGDNIIIKQRSILIYENQN